MMTYCTVHNVKHQDLQSHSCEDRVYICHGNLQFGKSHLDTTHIYQRYDHCSDQVDKTTKLKKHMEIILGFYFRYLSDQRLKFYKSIK